MSPVSIEDSRSRCVLCGEFITEDAEIFFIQDHDFLFDLLDRGTIVHQSCAYTYRDNPVEPEAEEENFTPEDYDYTNIYVGENATVNADWGYNDNFNFTVAREGYDGPFLGAINTDQNFYVMNPTIVINDNNDTSYQISFRIQDNDVRILVDGEDRGSLVTNIERKESLISRIRHKISDLLKIFKRS